jgi:aminopeptidase-like protein
LKDLIEKYFDRLWPINRSLAGEGNRETLRILSELVDLKISEIPSGTECFDWKVPDEWNAKEAWIKDSKGETIIDFKKNNLHLLGYSEKFHGRLSLDDLKKNLHSLPEQPTVIPYLTSYYKSRWGFCLSHDQLQNLKEDTYEVFIDSELNPNGSMTIGEAVLKGSADEEVLLSTYICHPSMANNELSGPLVTAFLYKKLSERKNRRYTYRFLFLPETIGSICYLSMNGEHFKKKLAAGYVITCVGDGGNFTYKRSRRGNTVADRAAELSLNEKGKNFITEDFFPTGSDERQYCSPGFNLPVGSLMRTRYGKYNEYHTSADNKDFISFEAMEESVKKYFEILEVIENNFTYRNKLPQCEPQLGKRDLYPTLGSQKDTGDFVKALMWILNLSDGDNDMIEISKRSGIPFEVLIKAAERLEENELIEKIE